jgi:cytidylate kinase
MKTYGFEKEESFQRPFVTVAREPGSGGAPIAKMVAEKLGFEFVDEQIVNEIATSTKLRKEIIHTVDEKTRSRIEDIVHSILNPEYIDDVKYITELTKVVLAYAHKGHVVIFGRGANFITPFAKGLHVNIVAPYEVRVQRAMRYEGFNRDKAEEVIAQIERERKEFVRQYFERDPNRINAYDLTLNTTSYEFNNAADLVVEAFYRKFPRTQRYGHFFQLKK